VGSFFVPVNFQRTPRVHKYKKGRLRFEKPQLAGLMPVKSPYA
jgi:hypothetical protein